MKHGKLQQDISSPITTLVVLSQDTMVGILSYCFRLTGYAASKYAVEELNTVLFTQVQNDSEPTEDDMDAEAFLFVFQKGRGPTCHATGCPRLRA